MFTRTSFIKTKLRGLSLKVFNMIENNGDCNFENNGEKVFVDNLFHSFLDNKESKVIFDIGANIGEYAEVIEKSSFQYNIKVDLHLFEPTKSCFSTISKIFEAKENITLNNFGASNRNGSATIYYDKEESGFASLYQRNLANYNIELNQSEDIILRRLDSYIEEKDIRHINFVKIDIEGHELNAFEGFGQYFNGDFIDYIQFEYGGANLDSHTSLMEIYKFLTDRGFKIAKVKTTGLEMRDYSSFMDNFNYSNYVAISHRLLDC